MSEITPPYVLQATAISHGAKLFRRAASLLVFEEGVASFNDANDLKVTERGAGANMSVDVAKGGAMINGDDTTDQGMYFVYNDATVNKTIATADPTNPRKDIVVARVKDNQEGQAGDTWLIDVITGTPAGSPVEPSLPATALKLAVVDVPANDTTITNSQITDSRTMADPPVNVFGDGVFKGTEPKVNFTGAYIDVVDNPTSKRVDVTESTPTDKSWNYWTRIGSTYDRYYGTIRGNGSMSTRSLPLGWVYFAPFPVLRATVIDRFAFEATSLGGGSSFSVQVGLYANTSDTDLKPSTKINTLVSTGLSSTGMMIYTTSKALAANTLYWLAMTCTNVNTPGTILSVRSYAQPFPIKASWSWGAYTGWLWQGPEGGLLPDSVPSSNLYSEDKFPAICVRYSS